jgi:hypothetical protein
MRTCPPLPPASKMPEGVGEALEHIPGEAGTRAAAREQGDHYLGGYCV